MSMSESELQAIVNNEREWRKTMYRELLETRRELHEFKVEMTTVTTSLKVKIGLASSIFGFIGGGTVTLIAALLK